MPRSKFSWKAPFSNQENFEQALVRFYHQYNADPKFEGNYLDDIAATFGVTRMAVNKKLGELRAKGIIKKKGPSKNYQCKPVVTIDKKIRPENFPEKMLDFIVKGNKLINEKDVRQEEVFPSVETKGWVGLIVGGDWHFEHYRTNTEAIVRELKIIGEEPNLFYGFNGDLGDFIDLRFMELENETINIPLKNRIEVIEYLVSLVPNMLFMVMGCHDNWVRTRGRQDIIEKIQNKIMGYYLGFGGTVNFRVGKQTYRIAAQHKYGYESKQNHFNPNYNYLIKMDSSADVVAVAHRHDIVGISNVYWQGIPRVFIRSGSHQYKTEYAWKEGFRGAIARYPMVLLNGKEKRMLPVINFKTGLPILRALNLGVLEV